MLPRNVNIVIWVLCLLGLCLRLGFVLSMEDKFYFSDSVHYDQIAKNVLSGKGLQLDANRLSYRPCGYPVFLAGIYALFGSSLQIVRVVQALLSALTPLVVFYLARQLYGCERIGIIACGITAAYPFFIFFSGLVLYETIFILMFLLFIMLLHVSLKSHGRWPVLAGVVAGIMILINPSMLIFPLFLLIGIFYYPDKRKWLACLLVLGLSAACVMLPWMIRNYKLHHVLIPATTQGGLGLYESVGPQADGGPRGGFVVIPDPERYQTMSEVEKDRYMKSLAVQAIKEDPIRFISLGWIKFKRMWNFSLNFSQYRGFPYNLISYISYGPIIILGIVGMWLSVIRKNKEAFILLMMPILYKTLLHMVFVGSIRYRVQIIAFVIIFAAYAINEGINLIRMRKAT